MSYRCVAASPAAFLAQLVRYVSSGHWFYVTGVIPENKDAEAVDRKLLALYDIDRPRWKRQRRYLRDQAGIHYLRHGRYWVLVLTKGDHRDFYRDHGDQVRDVRRVALRFEGYSVRYTYSELEKRERVFVRLDKPTYRLLRSRMLQMATRRRCADPAELADALRGQMQPWLPYAPVRDQFYSILRAVNRLRKRAGYPPVPDCRPEKLRTPTVFSDAA